MYEDDDEVVDMLENILNKETNEEVFETKSVTSRDLISTKDTEEIVCEEEDVSDRFSSKKKTRRVTFDSKTIILSDAKEAK